MDMSELSKLCDYYQVKRIERLAQEKVAEATKKQENELKYQILDTLREGDVSGIGGATHRFERVVKDEPQVDDWEELYTHILETKDFDLLHKRLTATAVKLRWDDEITIPGVGAYPVESLSVTKLK